MTSFRRSFNLFSVLISSLAESLCTKYSLDCIPVRLCTCFHIFEGSASATAIKKWDYEKSEHRRNNSSIDGSSSNVFNRTFNRMTSGSQYFRIFFHKDSMFFHGGQNDSGKQS